MHLQALLSWHLMVTAFQPGSILLLLGWQGATIKHKLKQVQAGCQQMPSPHQVACCGQQ